MVVVAIIAIISAIIVPNVLKSLDRSKKTATRAAKPRKAAQLSHQAFKNVPIIHSAVLDMTLVPEYRRAGMDVFTQYQVRCDGQIRFSTPPDQQPPIALFIPFPKGALDVRDIRMEIKHLPDSQTLSANDIVYDQSGLLWRNKAGRKGAFEADISFSAMGRDKLIYYLPPAEKLDSLNISLAIKGAEAWDIPFDAIQPTERTQDRVTWQINRIKTHRPIAVELPPGQSPLGKVALLFRLTGLAVLLFGCGFWYLTELYQPGQLKNFRLGHFLLLALNYSLYYVVFTVVSFQADLHWGYAILIAGACAAPLLVVHVAKVTDTRFAFVYLIPLVVFTIALVTNGVYGGQIRDYLFIGGAVLFMGFFTLTYNRWNRQRTTYKQERMQLAHQRWNALRLRVTDELAPKIAELQTLDDQAGAILNESADKLSSIGLYRLEEARKPIEALIRNRDALVDTLSHYEEMGAETGGFIKAGMDKSDEYDRRIDVLAQQAETALKEIQDAIALTEDQRPSEDDPNVDEAAPIYCQACGEQVFAGSFCQACGVRLPLKRTCGHCRQTTLLPPHGPHDPGVTQTVYCLSCGRPLVLEAREERNLSENEAYRKGIEALRSLFADHFEAYNPYQTEYHRGLWRVYGSAPKGVVAETPQAKIRDRDGKVIEVKLE